MATAYKVVVGNGKDRHICKATSVEECGRIIREYIEAHNISGIYGYGFEDEGHVYTTNNGKLVYQGMIAYNGRFFSKDDEYGKYRLGRR